MTSDPSIPSGAPKRATPQSFRARAMTASLTVTDLRASLGWFTDVLGFTLDKEHERDGKLVAASLKAGQVRLLLAQDDGAKGSDRVRGVGFSLQFTTAQDVDEIARRVRERGGILTTEPIDAWGARVFRVEDPDGFKLVISSERKDSTA